MRNTHLTLLHGSRRDRIGRRDVRWRVLEQLDDAVHANDNDDNNDGAAVRLRPRLDERQRKRRRRHPHGQRRRKRSDVHMDRRQQLVVHHGEDGRERNRQRKCGVDDRREPRESAQRDGDYRRADVHRQSERGPRRPFEMVDMGSQPGATTDCRFRTHHGRVLDMHATVDVVHLRFHGHRQLFVERSDTRTGASRRSPERVRQSTSLTPAAAAEHRRWRRESVVGVVDDHRREGQYGDRNGGQRESARDAGQAVQLRRVMSRPPLGGRPAEAGR